MLHPNLGLEYSLEKARRIARSLRTSRGTSERRALITQLSRKPQLAGVIDKDRGYGRLPSELIAAISPAVSFARQVRSQQPAVAKKKADYNPTILSPIRYEDAPPFFDLALSDDILQIASEYLGEIPVLVSMKLWCTPPAVEKLKGSQYYHRDGRQWLLRYAKFLINMDDVFAETGPFTFLPADVSERISKSFGTVRQARVKDDDLFRFATPSDAISLIGRAGTGFAVDSARCFHFGGRVQKGERLLLQFNFRRLSDAVEGGPFVRSPLFEERFGNDPIRKLVVPNSRQKNVADDMDE